MQYFIFLFIFFFDSLGYTQGAVRLLGDSQDKMIEGQQDERALETFNHFSINGNKEAYKQQVGKAVTSIRDYKKGTIWLLVDTQKKIIQVKQDKKTLETFRRVSIGRNGAGYKQQVGDGVTPIGTYKISYTNNESHFRKFFGLNYPSAEDADLALFAARISYTDYQAIIQAHKSNQAPPQNTELGGLIGIHGLGSGNKKVHGEFDWTRGCVALSNQQIDKLAKWVYKGMRVQIK